MKTKFVSLFLAFSLVISLVTVPAFAMNSDNEIGYDKNFDLVSSRAWSDILSSSSYLEFLRWAGDILNLSFPASGYTQIYDYTISSLGYGEVSMSDLRSYRDRLQQNFVTPWDKSSQYYRYFRDDESLVETVYHGFANAAKQTIWLLCAGSRGWDGPDFDIQYDESRQVYRIKETTLDLWVTDTLGRFVCCVVPKEEQPVVSSSYRLWSEVASDLESGLISYHIVNESNIETYAKNYSGTKFGYLGYWVVRSANSQGILCDSKGCPYAAWSNPKQTATNTERVDPETGDMTLLNPAFSAMLGDVYNIDDLYYDASTQTYNFNAYDYDITQNTYNYYSYEWTYNIEYTSITYIGASEEYTETYDVYYTLPDGRSSADLTKEELEQLNLEIDVINYGRGTDDTRLRSLYHLDGNTEDASYWNYATSWDWVSGSSLTYLESNAFNGCLYLDELDHEFTLTLPSSLGSVDFTLDFRYYQSATLAPQLDSYINVGGQQFLQMNGSHFLFGNSSYSTPVGNWNHLALVRSDGVLKFYLNGVQQGSVSNSSVLSNVITFSFGTDQQTYKYLDEIRVTNFPVWTSNFNPPVVPYDTNLALVLPTDSVPVADEYWDISVEGTNLLSQSHLDWWDKQHSNSGVFSDHFIPLSVSSSTDYVTPVVDGVKGSRSSQYLIGDINRMPGSMFSLYVPANSYSFSDYTTFNSTPIYPFDYYYEYVCNGLTIPIYHTSDDIRRTSVFYPSQHSNLWAFDYPYSSYTFTMVSADGSVGSYSFDLSSFSFPNIGSLASGTYCFYSDDYIFNGYVISLQYSCDYYTYLTFNNVVISLCIIPTTDAGEIVYLSLEQGEQSTVSAEYVTSVTGIPQENLNTPTLAVRSEIPVTDYQIGGIRPTFAERGQVYAMVENGFISSLQIYTGYAWVAVDGRIWTGERWIPYSSYNVITLSDMYDIADASGQSGYEYIYTETGFWAWWQKSWLSFVELFKQSGGSGGGGTVITENTTNNITNNEYTGDVSVTNVIKESGKSMWDVISGLMDTLGGVFSETGEAVGGMTNALSEPEDDSSVWYLFDVPYEMMSPVGEGD